MTKMCDTFQELELERIGFLRNEIWIHVNMHSTTLYDVDQVSLTSLYDFFSLKTSARRIIMFQNTELYLMGDVWTI